MDIRENLDLISREMHEALANVSSLQELEALKVKVLGKKGSLTALLRSMGQLSPEDRPKAGQMINETREQLTAALEEKQVAMASAEKEMRLKKEAIDVTEPRDLPLVGDRKYGGRDDAPAPMLFSYKLTFPYGKGTMEFEKLPEWAL